MKSIIEQLEELKNGDNYHDCGIDKAIAIVNAGREAIIDELDQKRINNDLWRMTNSELEDFVLDKIDEIIGKETEKPPTKARSKG